MTKIKQLIYLVLSSNSSSPSLLQNKPNIFSGQFNSYVISTLNFRSTKVSLAVTNFDFAILFYYYSAFNWNLYQSKLSSYIFRYYYISKYTIAVHVKLISSNFHTIKPPVFVMVEAPQGNTLLWVVPFFRLRCLLHKLFSLEIYSKLIFYTYHYGKVCHI